MVEANQQHPPQKDTLANAPNQQVDLATLFDIINRLTVDNFQTVLDEFDWDNTRLKNLLDAVDAQDATTLSQVQALITAATAVGSVTVHTDVDYEGTDRFKFTNSEGSSPIDSFTVLTNQKAAMDGANSPGAGASDVFATIKDLPTVGAAGALTLLETITASTDEDELDFSVTLDGDTDEYYEIVGCCLVHGDRIGAGAGGGMLRINGSHLPTLGGQMMTTLYDPSGDPYTPETIYIPVGGAIEGPEIFYGYAGGVFASGNSGQVFFRTRIMANRLVNSQGRVIQLESESTNIVRGNNATPGVMPASPGTLGGYAKKYSAAVEPNPVANITSLGIHVQTAAAGGKALGQGSSFSLYKRSAI